MARIVGISGSLRAKSFNTALLRAAVEHMPAGVTLEVASIAGIPLYDGDVEAKDGIPAAVTALKEKIIASDGVLIVTPEYNNSLPGVLKNAIDWLSRPPGDVPKVFIGRPVAVIGASPGPYGTILSQNAWLSVIRTLRMRPWFGARLMVAHADKVFNEAGALVDEGVRKQLQTFLKGYAEFVKAPH
ncbi:MAG TPA: NADPH-dependent FMN reductase [Steroidobacteraceae bacterium]|nr:NADPH-dependent FMN reductase [Steroidobacteraceae bacterium]